jgi:hypothetical protein
LKLGLLVAFCLATTSVFAQFYNGLQMSFGKNRVQYDHFYWQYYRFEKFDVYFNQFGPELAQYTEWSASRQIKRLESLLDYTLDKRIIFLVYNRLSDFRQSNIGLVTGNDDYNIGGNTRIVNNKVFLYFDGDHSKFEHQISAAIAQVILNQMLYGNELRENVANSTLINLPEWFIKGLLSYFSENWSVEIEDHVKEGVLSGKYKKFNRLTGDDAMYAGHSFWKYIEKTYGRSVIPNIIYITRVNKNSKNGFLNVVGSSLKVLSAEWLKYYQNKYKSYNGEIADAGTPVLKHPKKRRVYEQIKASPDGSHIAYVTNEMGQYRIWLYDLKTGKKKCLLRREHRLDQIPDYSFPVLSWHPSGQILTFMVEAQGGIKLSHYNIQTRELNTKNFLYMTKVLDFSYSDDGSKLLMSAIQNGKTDIYVHTLASATNEQITNDLADDLYPRFIDNSKKIIFCSNRITDSLDNSPTINPLSKVFNLYVSQYPRSSNKLTKISGNEPANQFRPFELSHNRFTYLGDNNGIVNRYIAEYDSTINMVDTAIHYRYMTKTYPVTNYPRNILEQNFDKKTNKISQLFFWKKKNRLYNKDMINDSLPQALEITEFRKEWLKGYNQNDSSKTIRKEKVVLKKASNQLLSTISDTAHLTNGEIDINHYVFEIEKLNLYNEKLKNANVKLVVDTTSGKSLPKIRIYQTAFYVNNLVTQVDFSFLNSTYQVFNNGANYYNPGFNLFFKVGANDLFEDYKIIGGLRFSADLESNEYLLSLENLKKRLDKQIVFHRVAYKSTTDNNAYIKTITSDGYYILKYPLSQVMAIKGTGSLRYDRVITLASSLEALNNPDVYNVWGGLKLEFIFDNVRSLGININSGSRYKVFGEAYKQINKGKSDLFVLGADFRHYQVIHRNLILASRFAGSTTFGSARLIYYLGAVDNWINLSTKVPTFDNSIRIDNQGKYAFQATATNMRGFVQNARNGNNFMVLNNELRWPFIKYFANYPISSSFWSSLQLIGFFDVGTAWAGLTPYSGKNAYGYDIVPDSTRSNNAKSPLIVTLDSNRSPIIYGYGIGVRAQLLGYFIRLDWAWGIEHKVILPKVFYLSFSLDF